MTIRHLRYTANSIVLLLCLSTIACNKTKTESKPNRGDAKKPAPRPQQSADTALPEPDLTPRQVVEQQLEAIRASKGTSDGLETALQFSSPANKVKMAVLIRSANYQPLLNYKTVEFGSTRIDGIDARQIVTLYDGQGRVRMFLFDLRRQTSGSNKGHWLTEAIHPGQLDIVAPISESSNNTRVHHESISMSSM